MKKVLVVDDEFDLTTTVRAILQHHGYEADVCSSGKEAIQCVRSHKPDLLLLDVMIPLGSGYDVLAELRKSAEFAELPVVLMNAVPPSSERQVQWNQFLRKPLSIQGLLNTIEQLIGPPTTAV